MARISILWRCLSLGFGLILCANLLGLYNVMSNLFFVSFHTKRRSELHELIGYGNRIQRASSKDIISVDDKDNLKRHNLTRSEGIDSENEEKPFLIYYIGPPNTGTSTIDEAFRVLQEEGVLRKDGYSFYSKKYNRRTPLDPLISDTKCHEELVILSKNTSIEERRQTPCWQKLVKKLKPHRDSNTNLLWSNEVLSYRSFRLAHRWGVISELLADEWNVIVVVTYRRYFEWLWTSKRDNDRWSADKARMNMWPKLIGAKNKERMKAKEPVPFYPKFTSQNVRLGLGQEIPFYYIDSIMDQWIMHNNFDTVQNDLLTIRMANMHHESGLLIHFVCDILPRTYQMCQSLIENKEKWLGSTMHESAKQFYMTYYDALALKAARGGFVNTTRYSRREMTLKLFVYHTDILNQTWNDLPVQCPSKSNMEDFLEFSLEKERSVWSSALSTQMELSHRQAFWQYYDEQKFCWLDHDTTLKMREWMYIFQALWLESYDPKTLDPGIVDNNATFYSS